MTINIEQVTRQCMDSINSKIKNLKKLNIIIIGKSGVGKSTLIFEFPHFLSLSVIKPHF